MSQLLQNSYFALFLIISSGIILGRFKVKGISLDLSAVIFAALILGHYGVVIPQDFQRIGLVLFIFTIGIQSGPGFFESFRKQGVQLILVSVVIVSVAGLIAVFLASFFNVDYKMVVGLFNGALTSTPGLAAAIESTKSAKASIGYGIAYPFGVIGVILFVRLVPKILHKNIKQTEVEYLNSICIDYPKISNQNFVVENINLDGKTVGDLDIAKMTGATISRVMHAGVAVTPNPETIIHLNDLIKAVGDQEALEHVRLLVGRPSTEEIPLSRLYDVQWVLVTNKKVVNKRLAQLHLPSYYNATITRIRRSGIEISPMPNIQIRFGDRLMVACDKENMKKVIELMGNDDKRLSETDFLPISLGIVLGVILGQIEFPLWGGTTFNLGITGGVLAVALILSRIGKTGPIIWSMSGPANQLIRHLGLLLFLVAVGTDAGVHLVDTVMQHGLKLIFVGAMITLLPMIAGLIIGHFIFKMNFLTLLGVITGAMTSTPGLAAVDTMSESNAPQVGYATVYPIALVLMIIGSQIIGRL
jgi:putative transport protein